MVASHAKMSADQHFALARRKYLRGDVKTLEDVCSIIQQSSASGAHIPCARGRGEEKKYYFRHWKSAFSPLFRKYKGLKKINYVYIDYAMAREGRIRLGCNGPNGDFEYFSLLQPGITVSDLDNMEIFQAVHGENVFQNCPAKKEEGGM